MGEAPRGAVRLISLTVEPFNCTLEWCFPAVTEARLYESWEGNYNRRQSQWAARSVFASLLPRSYSAHLSMEI
jgi:hypothetical protein